jgi:lipopolysaccharide/colanic/teichoic acid biosynthesis glycosyltransferase
VILKSIFDRSAAAVLLLVFSPLLAVSSVLVAVFLGRPIFFRQTRPGLHGTPFSVLKFRTMLDAVDSKGTPLPDAERLTKFGAFLRASSLDELPELWNVLRGQMSLVGPRPLLVEYLPRYSPQQARRHEAKPGITGWAQVNGRNAISWEQKFELDVWYVDNQSMLLDLKILWMTLWQVIRRDGISATDHVTMPPFSGTAAEDSGEPASS